MRPAYRTWVNGEMLDVLSVKVQATVPHDVVAIETIYGELTHGFILLPYTGLFDTKGQPVYTGDILTLAQDDGPIVNALMLATKSGLKSLTKNTKDYLTYEQVKHSHTIITVLGNRYQNPELLTLYQGDENYDQ